MSALASFTGEKFKSINQEFDTLFCEGLLVKLEASRSFPTKMGRDLQLVSCQYLSGSFVGR